MQILISEDTIHKEFNRIKKGCENGYDTTYAWNEIVLYFQWKEFYKKEIELWNENKIFRGLPLRSYIYANRLKYIGKGYGELTDREILRAFKISGVYIGNSFHSPFYIQQFIKDYGITSIYDPCGGWGHRMLGAVAVGCEYSYNDINPVAYENCIQMQKFLGFSTYVYNNDAACFTPSEDYEAVFTCPPYFNIEKYTSFGAENLSYEDFLTWWESVIRCSIKPTTKYFCFIINNKFSDDMLSVCLKSGLTLLQVVALGSQNHLNHFERGKFSKKMEILYILLI